SNPVPHAVGQAVRRVGVGDELKQVRADRRHIRLLRVGRTSLIPPANAECNGLLSGACAPPPPCRRAATVVLTRKGGDAAQPPSSPPGTRPAPSLSARIAGPEPGSRAVRLTQTSTFSTKWTRSARWRSCVALARRARPSVCVW